MQSTHQHAHVFSLCILYLDVYRYRLPGISKSDAFLNILLPAAAPRASIIHGKQLQASLEQEVLHTHRQSKANTHDKYSSYATKRLVFCNAIHHNVY